MNISIFHAFAVVVVLLSEMPHDLRSLARKVSNHFHSTSGCIQQVSLAKNIHWTHKFGSTSNDGFIMVVSARVARANWPPFGTRALVRLAIVKEVNWPIVAAVAFAL